MSVVLQDWFGLISRPQVSLTPSGSFWIWVLNYVWSGNGSNITSIFLEEKQQQ